VAEAPAKWVVEELAAEHDRSAFSCGQESLDQFIRQYASQNQKTGVSRTFVVTQPRERIVRGYYAISAGAVAFQNLPEEQTKRLPRYPVPVAHLGRLAVDRSAQGQGLGEFLLIDALRRIEAAAQSIGIHAIEVVAIDDPAKRFYLKYGFVELKDDPYHLYISLKTVARLGLAED
jgi:ribosomal protein S18 acetylase RimI-like enzyme